MFSGEEEGWYRHIHIVQAIKKSNGWSDENCGVAVICTSERGGVGCGSFVKKKSTGDMDRTCAGTDGILPVPRQAGGAEKAVLRERSATRD